jgi:hypothetical protein
MSILRTVVAIAMSGMMVDGSQAATFVRIVHSNHTMLALNGDITLGDAEQFQDIVMAPDGGHPITAIVLNSPGGNLVASVALAKLVRERNFITIVGPGATCASACFLVFAAGHVKYADYTSFLGVHSVADKGGLQTTDSRTATFAFARIIEALGTPAQVVDKLLATPPQQIVQLTASDLRGMGVIMTGNKARKTDPPRRAPPALLY